MKINTINVKLLVIAYVVILGGVILMPVCMGAQAKGSSSKRLTHPLMPGVRCAELWNTDWPRTLHDKQITGFSPLICDMKKQPRVWATIKVGGELNWVQEVRGNGGNELLLVNDGRLRLVTLNGEVKWTGAASGNLFFFGDLRGNGHDYLLIGGGRWLTVLDAETGKMVWTHQFNPPHVQVRVAVADILPDRQGMEAVVFLAYGTEGCLINFPPTGEPEIIWQRTVVVPGEWPERADHGCHIRLDLSVPDEPIIWNVRHHRCRGFNARTGEMVSSLIYKIGGGYRRNYGPWTIGRGKDGHPVICVVAEAIQEHVHCIRLNRKGPSELAWQHYYGEVYVVPGVAVKNITMEDMDGDGITEVVYNVRDPAQDFRSFVRVRDAETGKVEAELQDSWCVGHYTNLGVEGINGILAYAAPNGATPGWGNLVVYRFEKSGQLRELATINHAARWGPVTLPAEKGNDLLVYRINEKGETELVRYALRDDKLEPVARTQANALLETPARAVVQIPDAGQVFLIASRRGNLEAVTWEGKRLWEISLSGGPRPTMSAADINGNGRAELAAATAGHGVHIFSLDESGKAKEIASYEFRAPRYRRQSPLFYDLEGNGQLCLIAPGSTAEGKVVVRAYRNDGSLLWETPLGISTADNGMAVAWDGGDFLPGSRSAVAISVANTQRTVEGTYLLDGPTGKILWYKGLYHDGNVIRAYRPIGIPSAFDLDGDGVEEICMDMYSYLAVLRGTDGSFAYIRHTPNIRPQNALYAALLYNSYCPVYKSPNDKKPHWFVPLGHGVFGLMNPEPSTGVWRETLGYDVPPKAGMIDVDGDGVMEVGYAALHDTVFKCRNLWTGEVKWQVNLPSPPNSPVITADVDGDGKGEFLVGKYCIGTDAKGKGEIRWKSPVWLGWAIIADFDGDGKGEIACAAGGAIYILKAHE